MKTQSALIGALLLALAVLAGTGCGKDDSLLAPAAPSLPEPDARSVGPDMAGAQMGDFVRLVPRDQIVTAMIGPEGGRIACRDLSVDFPSGCLSETTRITLRVRSGQEVLFQVAPVDLKLDRPVALSFVLRPCDDPKITTFLRYEGDTLRILGSRVFGQTVLSESDRLGDFLIGPSSLDGSKGRAGW